MKDNVGINKQTERTERSLCNVNGIPVGSKCKRTLDRKDQKTSNMDLKDHKTLEFIPENSGYGAVGTEDNEYRPEDNGHRPTQ